MKGVEAQIENLKQILANETIDQDLKIKYSTIVT